MIEQPTRDNLHGEQLLRNMFSRAREEMPSSVWLGIYDQLSDEEKIQAKWLGRISPEVVDSWQLFLRQHIKEETEALRRVRAITLELMTKWWELRHRKPLDIDMQAYPYQYSTKSRGRRNGKRKKR